MNLRYGINPEQMAKASLGDPGSPVRLVSGEPSYVNVLDAVERLAARPRGSAVAWATSGDLLQARLTDRHRRRRHHRCGHGGDVGGRCRSAQ